MHRSGHGGGGLENVIGIVGFGAAAAALIEPGRLTAERAKALHLTEALLGAATSVSDVSALGDTDIRVPHIVNVAVGGVLAEAVLLGLDRSGIAAHSGSACSSESIEPSPVLAAMGVDPDRSLRLSVGWSSTEADVGAFAEAFPPIVERLRHSETRSSRRIGRQRPVASGPVSRPRQPAALLRAEA